MLVERIGLTPVKGGRHQARAVLDLTPDGPIGDRVFCLVDRSRRRVLRTVENPSLVRGLARWDSGVLSVDVSGTTVEGVPRPSGEVMQVDYWGRVASVQECTGPWALAYSAHLGFDVVLCRPVQPGEVVYGASVSLVTTASMRHLSDRVGAEVASARFRSTLLIDTGGAPVHVEDSWVGRTVQVGGACLRVRSLVPRCAVIDLDPVTGDRDLRVLKVLAEYRRREAEIVFGVDGVVTRAGRVRPGDRARVEPLCGNGSARSDGRGAVA